MSFPNRVASYLGLALMLSLLTFVPTPGFAACKNSGGTSGSHKFGSQVNGGSVTICATAVAVTPARTAVVKLPAKVAPKPAAKPAAKKPAVFRKQPLIVLQQDAPKPASKPVSKPASKPKPTAKPKNKSKLITKPASKNVTSASANFTPTSVAASVYPSNQLGVGQLATFVTSAVVHYRSGTLLAIPTEVRFTPVEIEWDLGDGFTGTGQSLNFAYEQMGTFAVLLRVRYEVSYRYKGTQGWIAEPDSIQVSDNLFVEVSELANIEVPQEQGRRKALLVGQSCLERPGTFGCN